MDKELLEREEVIEEVEATAEAETIEEIETVEAETYDEVDVESETEVQIEEEAEIAEQTVEQTSEEITDVTAEEPQNEEIAVSEIPEPEVNLEEKKDEDPFELQPEKEKTFKEKLNKVSLLLLLVAFAIPVAILAYILISFFLM